MFYPLTASQNENSHTDRHFFQSSKRYRSDREQHSEQVWCPSVSSVRGHFWPSRLDRWIRGRLLSSSLEPSDPSFGSCFVAFLIYTLAIPLVFSELSFNDALMDQSLTPCISFVFVFAKTLFGCIAYAPGVCRIHGFSFVHYSAIFATPLSASTTASSAC